jgi:hypothetical protein
MSWEIKFLLDYVIPGGWTRPYTCPAEQLILDLYLLTGLTRQDLIVFALKICVLPLVQTDIYETTLTSWSYNTSATSFLQAAPMGMKLNMDIIR